MKIALVMSLYNEFYLIENTLDSILGDTKYECDVFINLSGSRFFEKNIEYLNKIKNKNYRLFMDATKLDNVVINSPVIGNNFLVHKVYNELKYDIMVGGSPDYILKEKKSFDYFIDRSIEHIDNKYTISCVEHEGSNLRSAFQIITKKCIDEVGYYDPNFIPVGCSDNDFHRRCLLTYNPGQSLEYYSSPENDINAPYGVSLVVPSCHLSYTDHGALGIDSTNYFFKTNFDYFSKKYYLEKWGGLPGLSPGEIGKEKYLTPFDDPNISLKISFEHLKNGYSKHDRGYLALGGII